LAGGLAGTIVMTQFQNAWTKSARTLQSGNGQPGGSGNEAVQEPDNAQESNHSQENSHGEDATMKAAGGLASIAGYHLSHQQKAKAGPWVHYGFGTLMGGAYGLAHELAPRPIRRWHPLASGTAYGAALFLGADEVAVPALGLSGAPQDSPLGSHLYGLASHLVYGLTVEAVRKALRARL
jgi:uncharacterized membrane protein YagU involved in acid resistance